MRNLQFFACLIVVINTTKAFVPMQSERINRLCLKYKNSDRARVEKHLEDLMDNDWRLFRANLIAQESIESQDAEANKISCRTKEPILNGSDQKETVLDKVGHIIAAIFDNNHTEEEKKDTDEAKKEVTSSIFIGNAVGDASSCSNMPMPECCEDPFVSAAEIPLLPKSKVSVDKHRWAHLITHIETGCVLVANENLGGVFHQTVVLIINHNDVTGSEGIVINRPLGGDLLKIANDDNSNVDLSLKMAFSSASVTFGGPVKGDEYSVLHGYGEVEGSRKVAPGVFVGGSEELMTEVRKHNLEPKQVLFVKGHAVWKPGQLSRELSKGAWYVASCSSDFMLRYAGAPISKEDNKDDLWADILTCMGGRYADVAIRHVGKGDRRMS